MLLLSWMIDPKPIDDHVNARNWAAYYNVVVDPGCFNAISERAALLTKTSSTLSEWENSDFGQLLRVTDVRTLTQVREFWIKYSDMAKLSSRKFKEIRERFMHAFRQIRKEKVPGISVSGLRAVGAPFMNAMESVGEEYNRFWETGIIGGLPEFTQMATHINPLFVCSKLGGDQCVIHYGTDPILGFHCAPAFAETIGSPCLPKSPNPSIRTSRLDENVHRLSRTAVVEFKAWCVSFQSVATRSGLEQTSLAIYHFCGDAVKFCYSLLSAMGKLDTAANLFDTLAAPWNPPLSTSPNAEFVRQYDVIDTSNLGDHMELLNVLTCTLPVLKSSASSVLYTESLVRCNTQGSSHFERLRSLLCGDHASIFCLLRAAPME